MRGIEEYKAVNIGSASKEELVLMLYEAAVRHQLQATEAFANVDTHGARGHLRKVRDIFAELMVALDHDSAPELAGNLARLYSWIIAEVGRAGLNRDPVRLEATLRVTHNLLDGWVEAFRDTEEG
jgi:flagellar secretion chaperone FliS